SVSGGSTGSVAEALALLQAASDVPIGDQAGDTFAFGSGHPSSRDDKPTDWGWSYPTPGIDSEFHTPSVQTGRDRPNSFPVQAHDMGHRLGQNQDADVLMPETFTTGSGSADDINGSSDLMVVISLSVNDPALSVLPNDRPR